MTLESHPDCQRTPGGFFRAPSLSTALRRDLNVASGPANIGRMSTDQQATTEPVTVPVTTEVIGPLVVSVKSLTVRIVRSGKLYQLKCERVARWLKVLADRPGVWVSTKDAGDYDSELIGRVDQLAKRMPKGLQEMIDALPGKGKRLRVKE